MKKNNLKKDDKVEFNISTRLNKTKRMTGRIISILKNYQGRIISYQIKDKKGTIYNKSSFSIINKI